MSRELFIKDTPKGLYARCHICRVVAQNLTRAAPLEKQMCLFAHAYPNAHTGFSFYLKHNLSVTEILYVVVLKLLRIIQGSGRFHNENIIFRLSKKPVIFDEISEDYASIK